MSRNETSFEGDGSVDVREIQAELTAARHENAELKDKYLRAAASVENARKQAERMAAAGIQNRLKDLYVRLVEVVDNLERALAYSDDDDPLAPGVRATREQLLDVLRREGVAPVDLGPRGSLRSRGSRSDRDWRRSGLRTDGWRRSTARIYVRGTSAAAGARFGREAEAK